ncbi:type II toxin-antitoxin system HicB family antitoxin [Anaerosporobacter sp.]|uniref:type II toxin-antitoxin system HicB family antitoxin n=1 Tax=Anaerosporobacter sp. TaxID=1872529 RepID=UPI00286F10F6|nr:type II toxin-antitoxin system HicB family antitoxin [Anaerosporobacter sp.]
MSSMMEYKGYHATVGYDADDKIFIGEVFGIVDSLNFHGSSVDELEEMFHQSIDNYLHLCKECGQEPDKEFKGSFNVRIPSDLHRRIALEATKQSMTLNQYVTKALERPFDRTLDNEK